MWSIRRRTCSGLRRTLRRNVYSRSSFSLKKGSVTELAERMTCSRRTVKRIVTRSYQRLCPELTPELLEGDGRE